MLEYPPGLTRERAVLWFEPYLPGTLGITEALAVAEHLEA